MSPRRNGAAMAGVPYSKGSGLYNPHRAGCTLPLSSPVLFFCFLKGTLTEYTPSRNTPLRFVP